MCATACATHDGRSVHGAGASGHASFTLENTTPSVDLAITIDDGVDYARSGQTLDYLVTLRNDGGDIARGVDVTTVLADALDARFAHWICLDADSGVCTASGNGALADSDVTVPAHGRVTYLLSVPVHIDATVDVVATQAMTSSADDPSGADATDTDVLVIFRAGFDDYGSDGAGPWSASTRPVHVGEPAVTLALPAAGGTRPVETLLAALASGGSGFRIERLTAVPPRVRLVAVHGDGVEQTGAWQPLGNASGVSVAIIDADEAPQLRVAWASGTATIGLDSGAATYTLRERTSGE